jgi:peptidase E
MKKTILCGQEAVQFYVEGDKEKVKNLLESGNAAIIDITVSTTLEDTIEQLKGWFDFIMIMGKDAEELLIFHYKLLKENSK